MIKTNTKQSLKTGDVIWQYRIEEHLGRGAFGDVYHARHVSMQRREVAIKQLNMSIANPATIQRFIHESYAMGELFHPNVVLVFELLDPEKYPDVNGYYIVMEYLDGGTLRNWMENSDTLMGSLPDAIRVTKEICRGLAAAHQEKIYHRDIKPENILLSRDGSKVKIGDWGLAHLEGQNMTFLGDIMGTMTYMPPEQASGHSAEVDGRADLYSVGVMLYEMATGHLPLDIQQVADDAIARLIQRDPMAIRDPSKQRLVAHDAVFNAIATGPRIDPLTFVPDMPRSLAQLLLKSIAVRPQDRFQRAEDFSLALEKITLSKNLPIRTSSNEAVSKVASLLNQARNQRQERCFADALNLLLEARKIIQDDAGVALELGRLYNLMGKPIEAAKVLNEAAKQHPDNHVILRDLGFSYMGIQEKDLALQAIQRSLDINPNQSQLVKMVRRLGK